MHGQDSERLPVFKPAIVTYSKIGAASRSTPRLRYNSAQIESRSHSEINYT